MGQKTTPAPGFENGGTRAYAINKNGRPVSHAIVRLQVSTFLVLIPDFFFCRGNRYYLISYKTLNPQDPDVNN